jgi:ribosome maturation factor RimP
MRSEREVIEQVESLLLPILRDEGLESVDIEFIRSGRRWVLRLFIDKEGGVTISDCERVSREFGRLLDVEDIIDHAYTLEVSSPGLTRPLRKMEDFVRYRGKTCRIVTSEKVEGRTDFRGIINTVSSDSLEIQGELGVFTIPFCAIKKARLEFTL